MFCEIVTCFFLLQITDPNSDILKRVIKNIIGMGGGAENWVANANILHSKGRWPSKHGKFTENLVDLDLSWTLRASKYYIIGNRITEW